MAEEDNNIELLAALETLSDRIDRQNTLLATFLKSQTSFRVRLIAGLWTGLGTVLGATVVVSGIVLLLRPLSKIDWISPIVDKVISALENRPGSPRPRRIENSTQTQYDSDSSKY